MRTWLHLLRAGAIICKLRAFGDSVMTGGTVNHKGLLVCRGYLHVKIFYMWFEWGNRPRP